MKYFCLIISVAITASFCGCDLGTYGSRYNDRIGGMAVMANSNKDLADELIDVAGVAKVRIPRVCYNADSAKFGKNDDYVKARIPGIEIEGFVSSFMGDKESSDGKWYPFQVYFFYMPNKNIEEAKTGIKAAVGSVLTQTRMSWDSSKVEAYDGKQHAWSSATVGAGQPFLVFENNSEKQVNLNGRLDFYVTGNEQGVLAIAFRAPSSIFADEDRHLIEGTLKSIQAFK